MSKSLTISLIMMDLVFSTTFCSFAYIRSDYVLDKQANVIIELAKGRLFVGMTKI